MLSEVDSFVAQNRLYVSDRLSLVGKRDYLDLLRRAVRFEYDAWLAAELQRNCRLNPSYQRRNPKTGGSVTVTMPRDAHETMAEGEFNRFYLCGLSLRAIDDSIAHLIVYRAKQVTNPRPESTAREGTTIDPKALLADLRANVGINTALGVPAGPNSGLSARLP
jgi:hypothetical protein